MLSRQRRSACDGANLPLYAVHPGLQGFFAAQFAALSAWLDRLNTVFQRLKLLLRVYIAHATPIIHY